MVAGSGIGRGCLAGCSPGLLSNKKLEIKSKKSTSTRIAPPAIFLYFFSWLNLVSHPSSFTAWERWKFSNCIFAIPKAFWLFLWQWEKSKMYSIIEADYFSKKNWEYFYGAMDQLDVNSEMSDDVIPAWQRQAVCKSQGYFFSPHRTCKAIWIIFLWLTVRGWWFLC